MALAGDNLKIVKIESLDNLFSEEFKLREELDKYSIKIQLREKR